MLKELLSDLVKIDDILFVVRSDGSIIEMRSNSLNIRQKDKWITIGDNNGPCHMHVDSETITKIKFVEEKKPERTSYSVRFYDKEGEKTLSAVFAKMYDEKMNLRPERKKLYDELFQKYGSQETLVLN
ncbi:MAG: ChuX/HutX family heme-like substrate-binding protein [Nitrosopumilaceae archaeon]